MRAVVQRVSRAAVREVTTGEVLGSIGPEPGAPEVSGLCVLLGLGHGDTRAEADWLVDKLCGLRIFADAPDPDPEVARKRLGNMNRALRDVGGALLVISQFTLYADTSRGRRPSFTGAMPPAEAEALYEYFVGALRGQGHRVATGRFGAMMAVELVNEGPVTIWLDSRDTNKSRPAESVAAPAGQGS